MIEMLTYFIEWLGMMKLLSNAGVPLEPDPTTLWAAAKVGGP